MSETQTTVQNAVGLQRINAEMMADEVQEQARRRSFHYVYSPAFTFDLRSHTWRRLSKKIFPRGRITLLETFYYPTKNRSQSKMENPLTEPDVIAWEKTAYNQAIEFMTNYGHYGGVKLNCLTGVEPEVVGALESYLLPTLPDPEFIELLEGVTLADKSAGDLFTLPGQKKFILESAEERLALIVDSPHYKLACKLKEELLAAIVHAEVECNKWRTDTELELAKARAGQKAKSSLDPFDYKLYKALGRIPAADLMSSEPQRVIVQQSVADPSVAFDIADLKARLAIYEAAKADRQMKQCPHCANDILAEAVYCQYCHKQVPKTEIAA